MVGYIFWQWPIFPSELTGMLFGLIFALMLLSELVWANVIPALRRYGAGMKKMDRGSVMLIDTCLILMIIAGFGFPIEGIAMLPRWAFYPGIALMAAGILLRQWCMALLGRYFTTTVGVKEGQPVIERGPYRLVRHPSYAGTFLMLTGAGIALQSWGAALIILLLLIVSYGYRIYVEEKALTSELGQAYTDYVKRTKRLIPLVF